MFDPVLKDRITYALAHSQDAGIIVSTMFESCEMENVAASMADGAFVQANYKDDKGNRIFLVRGNGGECFIVEYRND